MLDAFQPSSVLLILIALVPGGVTWASGRMLRMFLDDPVLPERLVANQRRNGLAFFVSFAALSTLSPRSLLWTGPLLFLSVTAGSYPLRKTLFDETWGLGACLWFHSRMFVVTFGFWLLLAATPALASRAGSADWLAGGFLAAVLFFWNSRSAEVLRYVLRTQPLEDGPMLDRCRVLAAKCAVALPRFERIDLQGGVIVNALAMPSLRGSSVLFTDTLLARLEQDETAAICAHELAHLEYYNPARLNRMRLVLIGLIALGAVWSPLMRLLGAGSWTWLVWFCVLVAAAATRAHGKQKQETVCDERAVALMGDPDPLIRALTKLYSMARIPRRIDAQVERSDTHPSLARRIRSIRAAGGAAPVSLESVAAFTSEDGRTSITFETETLRCVDSNAVTHIFNYANLSELRVDARVGREPRLVICAGTQRWEMPLARVDVARAQSVLDVVDSRLGEHTPAAPALTLPFSFSRSGLAIVTLLALMMGHVSVAFVALLACLRPAVPLLVAAGVAALASAGIMVRDSPTDEHTILATPAVIGGLVFFFYAWSLRREERTDIRLHGAALAVVAGLAVCSVFFTGVDAVAVNQAARNTSAVLILPLALAVALACSSKRRVQLAAVAPLAVASCANFLASATFLDRFGHDPFLVDGPAIELEWVDEAAIDEFTVPTTTARLRLSPDGRHIAVLDQMPSGRTGQFTFHVGRAGEPLTALAGNDLIFLDDEHVLIAAWDMGGTLLRKVRLNDAHDVLWTQRVDAIQGASLTFDAASARWRLTGWSPDRSMVRADGVVGTSQVERTAWPASTDESWMETFTTTGSKAVVVENRYDFGALRAGLPATWSLLLMAVQPGAQESWIWSVGPDGRTLIAKSRFHSECHAGIASDGALVCTVFDGTRTRILSIDTDGQIRARGWLEGQFISDQNIAPEWLTGRVNVTPVAIKMGTRDGLRLRVSDHAIAHLTVSGDRIAAVLYGRGGPKVRTYPLRRSDDRSAKATLPQ